MKDIRIALLFLLFSQLSHSLLAQATGKDALTFEELYDDPYAVNKLFVGVQPFYGEMFATNVNAGFGMEAHYYHAKKFDVKAHFRKTYSSKFFDFNRELAMQNSVMTNKPEIFNYYELGGTYHVKDFDVTSTTKIFLYKKNFTANRWAAAVPLFAEVPAKLRKIIGIRAGAIMWNSTADLSRALDKQGLTNADLINSENLSLPQTYVDASGKIQDLNIYGNIYATNIYLGGSFSRIRNMAVSFNNYDDGRDDGILTFFMDIMVAPSLRLDPVIYNGSEYSTSPLKTRKIGVRAGMEGKFNRDIGWSYGGEIGFRPSMEGRGFFALIKIAFPVFSTNLEHKVEAFSN